MRRTSFVFLSLFLAVFAVTSLVTLATAAQTADPNPPGPRSGHAVRISQVYGGGGNAGAHYTHDFVELFNASSSPVSLDGLSLQYASATGTGHLGGSATQLTELPDAMLLPGHYYLVQQSGGSTGSPLPTPDHTDPTPINLAAASGKIALVVGTSSLGCNGGSTPCDADQLARIIDLVGYGDANFYEGTGAAPTLTSSTAAIRNDGGCTDSDDNAADFTAAAPTPRNSSSPSHSCSGAPVVIETEPEDQASNVPIDTTITVTFNEVVTVTAAWFTIACSDSGSVTGATTPAGPAGSYTITPADSFAYGEQCTVTVLADQVTNGDEIPMDVDYVFSFSLEATEGDVTFVYHDLEGVVQPGEAVYLAGDFNGWDPTALPLTPDAAHQVFTVTVTGLAADDYDYKYVVYTDTVAAGLEQWDWLNSTDRSLTVSGNATVNDYRNVVVGWANLQWPETLETDMGVATDNIYGKLHIQGVTNTPDSEGRGLKAQAGYGTAPDPATWSWFPMSFWADDGPENDQFAGVITPTVPGVFSYTTRYDGNWGAGNPNAGWTYADLNGLPYDPAATGVMTVSFAAVPIAEARAGSNGQIFGLEGQVTAQNNTWNNAPEWAFQDESGGIAAFFITDPPITLGDTVRLVATRGAFNNQEQMVFPLYYFEIVSPGLPVEPMPYTTGAAGAGDSEGWLVQMEGVVSSMPASCSGTGYSLTLNDGSGPATVRIEAATGINLCAIGVQNGDTLGVTGFSTQFQAAYQVKPRNINDLELFVEVPVVVSTTPANNATNVPTDTLITVQFNEPAVVTSDWFTISCSQSGAVTGSTSPAGPDDNYTITPDEAFLFGEMCVVTILADQVSNNNGANMFADYLFNFTVGPPPAFGACDDQAIPIHFIQGSGMSTPLFGATVVVEAVVVGSYQGTGQLSGFFLQEQDDRVDGDPATSEGIFVFHSSTAVAPGELVRVRGTATEFSGLTQMASVSNVAVCGSDYTVTPAAMTLPVDDLKEWEAVEGMLVSFTQDLYVTEHYNLAYRGEVHLSVNDRLWQPTNLVAPGGPANAMQDLNNRSRIILDDGLNVQNPATVIYPDPGLTYTNTLRTGAVTQNLAGVLDYRSSSYRIQPVGVVEFSNTAGRPETMADVGGTIQVASFNVLNYFTTLNTGALICGPQQNMGCRGANTALEFERQRTKILNAILAMDVDVIGLIEVENHHEDEAVVNLVAGLNDLAGAGTYAYIDTGVIGGDAIKQAFIYQPATVTPVGDYAILDSSVDPAFLDTKNRPVLIQTFADNSTGQMVTVAVNHLKSKGSPCDDVGDPDLGDGQANCNLTRTQAAAALVNFLATDPAGTGSDRFLIIGDINAYAMEDPIMAILEAGYTDLLRQFYNSEAYSYVFEGQFGHLDHALASSGILPFVTGATAWHINADEPRALDYNTEFKSAQQVAEWYGPGPFRSSDHDPVVVGVEFPEPEAAFSSDTYEVWEGAGEATITVTLSAPLAFTATAAYETVNGTAVAGIDYVANSGWLTFAPGMTTNVFTVEIIDNTQIQPDRSLFLKVTAFDQMVTATLTIMDDDEPAAGFTSNSPVVLGSLSVFTNTTIGAEPITYEWNFGDGSDVVTDEHPTHTYGAAGVYTVVLTATNVMRSDVFTGMHTVVEALAAGFTSNSPVLIGTESVFTNMTAGPGPINYEWDFGDGSAAVTDEHPSHTYAAAGVYTVILTATNASGSSTATDTFEVYSYRVFLPLVARDAGPESASTERVAAAVMPQLTGRPASKR
jgi:predicted extracellular nuclease/PKD repeat protein